MTQHLSIALFMLLASCTSIPAVESCGYRTAFDGTVFSLNIERSFDPAAAFQLCERKAPESSFLLVTTFEYQTHRIASIDKFTLDDSQFEKLLVLYEDALNINFKDDAIGLDGSSWCLETNRGFTYLNACFWSPKFDTRNRELENLVAFGQALWQFANLEPAIGRIY